MRRLITSLVFLLLGGLVGYVWLKAPYANAAARQVAAEFLHLLQAQKIEQAYAMTLRRQGLAGRDLAEFQRVVERQLCTRQALDLIWLHPTQSNGNRLRRRLLGREVEMPSVTARFEGACLISIELRRDREGGWRVFNFQSTAG